MNTILNTWMSQGQSWNAYWLTRFISGLKLTYVSDTELLAEWTNNGTQNYDEISFKINGTENVTAVAGATSKSLTGLTAGTLYTVEARYKKGSSYSEYSNVAVEITSNENQPTNVAANPVTGGVKVTWTDVPYNSGSVYVYGSIDSGDWELLATVNDGVQQYTHSITGSHTIEYKVYAELVADELGVAYQAVYNAFTTKPDTTKKYKQNDMIQTLVTDGVWANNIDAFWLFAGHINTDSESLIQWKNPTGDKALLAGTAVPVANANQGITGNGTSGYINLKWNQTDDGSHYTQDSASVIVVMKNRGTTGRLFGANKYISGAMRYVAMAYTGQGCLNSGWTLIGDETTDLPYYMALLRSASNVIKQYKNKGASVDASTASNGVVTSVDWFALADNANGTPGNFNNGTIAAMVVGNFNATQKNTIIDAIETYMDYINNSII